MKLKFFGAAGTVTGSRTLFTHHNKNILVDCGLFQGPKPLRLLNWEPFDDYSKYDAVFLTHAHLDHCGYIPLLVKRGFRGKIYCTHATRELARVILYDSAHLQEEDALYANLSGYSHHKPAFPLYTVKDAEKSFEYFSAVETDKWFSVGSEIQARFLRAGHLLGSSFVQIMCNNGNGQNIVTFSGDLGNGRSFILKPPTALPYTDFLVLESTYGDRHWMGGDPVKDLEVYINKVIRRGGTLLIPSFSVGRAQEVIYLINYLKEQKRIDDVPVYLDSPMANHASEIYASHTGDLQLTLSGETLVSPICFQHFREVESPQESILLAYNNKPKVIISASGMLTGGRVMHHLKHILPRESDGVLFVGYQARETKGWVLQNGSKNLRVHHQEIPVRCGIFSMDTLSAHAWSDDLINWISQLKNKKTTVFLNHGEPESLKALSLRIKEELNLKVITPQHNEEFEIETN